MNFPLSHQLDSWIRFRAIIADRKLGVHTSPIMTEPTAPSPNIAPTIYFMPADDAAILRHGNPVCKTTSRPAARGCDGSITLFVPPKPVHPAFLVHQTQRMPPRAMWGSKTGVAFCRRGPVSNPECPRAQTRLSTETTETAEPPLHEKCLDTV